MDASTSEPDLPLAASADVPLDTLLACLPDPVAIVSSAGILLRVNAAFRRLVAGSSTWEGNRLDELVTTPADHVATFLRQCASTRQPIPGTLSFLNAGGEAPWRVEGWVLSPRQDGRPAAVALRLVRAPGSGGQFLELTRRIGNLTAEIARRRKAEADYAAAVVTLEHVQHRLALLTDATEALAGSPSTIDVLRGIGSLMMRLIPADAHAVWCYEVDDGSWKVQWQEGLSSSFVGEISAAGASAGAAPFATPQPISDVLNVPLLADRRSVYATEGIASMLLVPLRVRGESYGTSVAYYRTRTEFAEPDIRVATAFGNIASSALTTARLYGDAQRANRIKDEFLATLSHELRTPLNAILGYTHMLRSGSTGVDRQPHALEVVERNATLLRQMVEDILDVSRIVAGKLRIELQQVDLRTVVTSAIATITPTADAKGVCVESAVEPGTPRVSGDPDRLQQVLWNLLSNAVKFTPRGGLVTVRVSGSQSGAEIAVSDTGAGISPEFLPHIFERFRQYDPSSTRSSFGLGLGLSIARDLVQLHGGSITASSEGPGRGCTFTVVLPALSPEEAPA